MPSLRKRVSSYFRQLSFHNEPRDKRNNVNENTFVTKYLQGHITLREGPPIIYGKSPTDLPNYELAKYDSGPDSVIGCYSGPNGGLTTVQRTEKHLSVLDADIDYIDTHEDESDNDATHTSNNVSSIYTDDSSLPVEWNRKSDFFYGLSDSLYDRNQVTKNKNGNPIADCFGIIARNDSAILAVADGVNWGEKASIAAKSAIHGCLHYLNKTIFNDTKPFENLTKKTDETATSTTSNLNPNDNLNLINNTREVFVCLLRAFNCAHDLILENDGMLTTLTVAVILPLKQKSAPTAENRVGDRRETGSTRYVCCVCNVGDTLAYVYSHKYGVRELTKGSHDITSNRDMRDALGALGPVDGINPELSNLTLSVTTLQKGDIVMVASDGLTDNFDPNVSRFTVNSTLDLSKQKRPSTSKPTRASSQPPEPEKPVKHATISHASFSSPDVQKPPIKPPRRSKNRSSMRSNTPSEHSVSSSEPQSGSTIHDGSSEKGQISSRENDVRSQESPKTENGNRVDVEYENPLIAQFLRENSVEDTRKNTALEQKKPSVNENRASSLRKQASIQLRQEPSKPSNKTLQSTPKQQSDSLGYKFMKSKTSIDLRTTVKYPILRNEDGIPYVTPIQRYELQLLLIEDILKNGLSGNEAQCSSAKKLCESLISYTISITSAKRHTLEELDLYFDNRNGVLVEVSNQEKKVRRKKALERVQNLPGKLDHVTVVAYNVGMSS